MREVADQIRGRAWSAALLDGVNAAALASMAGVTAQLASTALVDPLTLALTVLAGLLLWRTRMNSAWYIVAGALVGTAATVVGVAP